MGVDSHMFDHLIASLVVVGVAIGVALCVAGWALWTFVFSHIHWSWS